MSNHQEQKKTKVLVTGKNGQLAYELAQACPDWVELVCLGRDQLDLSKAEQIESAIIELTPDVVINTAAYTAVDAAEADLDNAFAINATAVEHIATACKQLGAKLLQISTDFVFDGSKATTYTAEDATNPLSVYGASKLAGEQAAATILAGDALIVRTAWVYSVHGGNFVKSMLSLMVSRDSLGIVVDQIGTPTWAKGLAKMLWALTGQVIKSEDDLSTSQILHWTDAGVASWYDFAVAIQQLALEKGLLDKAIEISPIPTASYPAPATRPSFSIIDKTAAEEASSIATVHWRQQLSNMLDDLKAGH